AQVPGGEHGEAGSGVDVGRQARRHRTGVSGQDLVAARMTRVEAARMGLVEPVVPLGAGGAGLHPSAVGSAGARTTSTVASPAPSRSTVASAATEPAALTSASA